ncbi:hypothetical protein LUZ60_003112 [Juncus effusus]|nr:hypothetical protein LUZ60_003112 [Juncus effusus]
MEMTSETSSCFSMAIDAIVFLLYNTIFIWLTTPHNVLFSFLSLFSSEENCKSRIPSQTTSCAVTNQKDSDSALELYKDDLELVMQKMGMTDDQTRDQVKEKMAFEELSDIFEEKEPSLEEVKEAFSVFDKNSDGFVDASDLQRILSELGFRSEIEFDECREMIQTYDENNDGRIDFNEFVKFMETSFC